MTGAESPVKLIKSQKEICMHGCYLHPWRLYYVFIFLLWGCDCVIIKKSTSCWLSLYLFGKKNSLYFTPLTTSSDDSCRNKKCFHGFSLTRSRYITTLPGNFPIIYSQALITCFLFFFYTNFLPNHIHERGQGVFSDPLVSIYLGLCNSALDLNGAHCFLV